MSPKEIWIAFPSPRDLPDPGMKPRSLTLQADSLPSEPPGKPILLFNHILFLNDLIKELTKGNPIKT